MTNDSKAMLFAAYDSMSIYAIGQTRDEAVRKAQADAGDDEAKFETAKIHTPLACYIEANGWHGNSDSFDVIDGWIANPTHRGEPIEV